MRLDFRDRYSSYWAAFGELVAVVMGLLIYSYTAKAFAPAFSPVLGTHTTDYFTYVLVGELVLLVPLQLVENMTKNLKQFVSQGTIDPLLMLPSRPQAAPVLLSLAAVPRESLRVAVTILLGLTLFSFSVSPSGLLLAFVLQLLALPVFLGIAMLACAVLVVFGRGYGLLAYAMTAAAVVAGAYFPTSVLPEALQNFGLISPFNALLEGTRLVLSSGAAISQIQATAWTMVKWGIVSLPIGYVALGMSLAYFRRRGEPLLFTV